MMVSIFNIFKEVLESIILFFMFCQNCIEHGFFNGVCIGYCANCVQLFDYKRGNGMIETGLEVNSEMIALDISEIKEENSMWNTYLYL